MLSASVFNLIMPGVADGGITPVAIGILLGAAIMAATSRWLHDREFSFDGMSEAGARRVILILAYTVFQKGWRLAWRTAPARSGWAC
jgi:hypothetical protein